ncbi:MAG: nuclear transport factor 2 family protein [Actinomycetota bacterium]|nr:nuclear transport factor 2 family protein [Actinomycetota bacterium]
MEEMFWSKRETSPRGTARATLVFVEQQGRWLLASIHLSFIAEGS